MSCNNIPVYNLRLNSGDNTTIKMRYKGADNTPVNISLYRIDLECEESSLSKTAIITDAVNGSFEFIFEPSDTASVSGRNLNYEIVFYPTGISGNKETILEGMIQLRKELVV